MACDSRPPCEYDEQFNFPFIKRIQKFSRVWIQDSFWNLGVQSKFMIGFFERIDSKIESRFKNFEDLKKI